MKDDDLVPAIIVQADMAATEAAQSHAELRNAMRRHVDRMAKFKAWVDPEAIKLRREQHEKAAAAALIKVHDRVLLPVPDPLPPEMRGQSASTIQAMLRNGWKPEKL